MASEKERGERVNPKIVQGGKVQTHAGGVMGNNDGKCDTKGHQETTPRLRPQSEWGGGFNNSSLQTPTKTNITVSKSISTPIKFNNSLSPSSVKPRKVSLDIFQALEISFTFLRKNLHDNYLKTKLVKFGEFERFKDLEVQRQRLLGQIEMFSGQKRGSWGNRQLPEFLFEELSLKIQLSAILEKLVSVLERNATDEYLRRVLDYTEYGLYKEAERVRRNAILSSSFILKKNDTVRGNYEGWAAKKGKFELTALNNGNRFGNEINVRNETVIEEDCTPSKRRLVFEE